MTSEDHYAAAEHELDRADALLGRFEDTGRPDHLQLATALTRLAAVHAALAAVPVALTEIQVGGEDIP